MAVLGVWEGDAFPGLTHVALESNETAPDKEDVCDRLLPLESLKEPDPSNELKEKLDWAHRCTSNGTEGGSVGGRAFRLLMIGAGPVSGLGRSTALMLESKALTEDRLARTELRGGGAWGQDVFNVSSGRAQRLSSSVTAGLLAAMRVA